MENEANNSKRAKSRNNEEYAKNQNQNPSDISKKRNVVSAVPNKSCSRFDQKLKIADERLLTMNDLQKLRLESELKMLNMKHEKELFRIAQYGLTNNIFSILKTEPNNKKKATFSSLSYENHDYIQNFHLIEQAKREQLYEIFEQKKKKRFENYQNYKREEAESLEKRKQSKIERTTKNLQRSSFNILIRRNKILSEIERKDAAIIKELNKNKNRIDKKIFLNHKEEAKKKIFINDIMNKKEQEMNEKIEKMNEKERIFIQKEKAIQWLKHGFKNYKEGVMDLVNNERKEKIVKLEKLIKNGEDDKYNNKEEEEFHNNEEIKKLFDEYDSVKSSVVTTNNNNKFIRNQKLEKSKKKNDKKDIYENLIPFNDLPKENIKEQQEQEEEENEKNMLTKEAIKRKVKKYRKEKYRNLLKIVDEEKMKEEKRKNELKNIKDEEEKSKLEGKYGKERTFVSIRLKNEKEKIDAEVRNYEERLNEEYLNMTGIKIDINSSM